MLIEITPEEFDVTLALAYATSDNVTGTPIYRHADCYLHKDAARLLMRAAALARPLGLRFKIFDAYRPSEGQWALWRHNPDPDFVMDPRKGSHHTRGVAIDLTLIEAETGRDLDMGTPFDDFTERSHHAATDIAVTAQCNRFLLLGIMSAAGWDFYKNEWWHYQLFKPREYPLIEQSALRRKMMDDAA
ncbi:MAG TPA: D-alanyl-D-alanine dipeptidase [Dongiaceae bacterium]|jgi:D-alanyl-D-alanine dipeptidase|nr:D-alanyl-D-alanine dipeptidase [Dongiaceae bacterium]